MKFGKQIQSQQIPGWGAFYLDYNLHPDSNDNSTTAITTTTTNSNPLGQTAAPPLWFSAENGLIPTLTAPTMTNTTATTTTTTTTKTTTNTSSSSSSSSSFTTVPMDQDLIHSDRDQHTEHEPLPPSALPPTPGFGIRTANERGFFELNPLDRSDHPAHDGRSVGGKKGKESELLVAHRTVFFFKLEREIEKINAFYLQKERDLRLRLLTLISNRKRILLASRGSNSTSSIESRNGYIPHGSTFSSATVLVGSGGSTRAEWKALEEGWKVFERDLSKLQQFIEINATGFRKILKKWDKRSKSNTKELYLERQVEVQPCFNREFMAKLSDVVAANLLDQDNGTEGLYDELDEIDLLDNALDPLGNTLDPRLLFESSPYDPSEALADLSSDLTKAIHTLEPDAILSAFARSINDITILECPRQDAERVIWKAALDVPESLVDDVIALIGDHLSWDTKDRIHSRTILHEAAISGSLALVRHCVQRGIHPGLRDCYERIPLHYGTMNGHPGLVPYLLSVGSDPSLVDTDGYTPLIHAIVNGQTECVRILLDGPFRGGNNSSVSSVSSGSGSGSGSGSNNDNNKPVDSNSAADTTNDGKPSFIEPLMSISNDLIPLSLACEHGHEEVARLLLRKGAKVIPNSEGLYPLHLAAREGHAGICRLLVQEGGPGMGGRDRKDKYNEWTPLFHACLGERASHVDCVNVLVDAGSNVNETDEYGKTSLFYASYYHIGSINILLQAGANVQANKSFVTQPTNTKSTDDTGSSEMKPLSDSPGSNFALDEPMESEAELDAIPSLLLPPPIVPLQIYGHSYLDKECMVQLSLGHPFSRKEALGHAPVLPVKLYSQSEGHANMQTWSSIKLVMTSKPDFTSMPHSVILPLADEREVFNFHVSAQDLPQFALDFSLYPTFGSKVIGKAVVLFSAFEDVKGHQAFVAPILDHHLKTIGEVSFELSVVRPFVGVQLEIGGRVETYWKSTLNVPSFSGVSQDHGRQPHRPLSVFTSSPRVGGPTSTPGGQNPVGSSNPEAGLVTSTSLSGKYVHVIVQVTRDLVPVVYSDWELPVDGFQIGVADVTFAQFQKLGQAKGRSIEALKEKIVGDGSSAGMWHGLIKQSMASLDSILATLPVSFGVNLELRYTNAHDAARQAFNNIIEINQFVDAILRVIYRAGNSSTSSSIVDNTSFSLSLPPPPTTTTSAIESTAGGNTTSSSSSNSSSHNRKIIFSAFDPNVASLTNYKQPNYAVFFASYCGLSRTRTDRGLLIPLEVEVEADKRCVSVREAVKFARANNLLGVLLDATLLAQVPFLIYSVKESGLILGTFGEDADLETLMSGHGIEGLPAIDAFMKDGVMSHEF
ncbi:FOG: Ankyrin repeat [Phaffia rhodozyma]|uniref:FOG: Ankyrin repeat n=1 Tax=Phaffia rhodozyma TaxID=264483 RepID=A0A0F7SHR0_PHARH|nr:FOG: Ankyrin repeat [Phaffia rhodozyma]